MRVLCLVLCCLFLGACTSKHQFSPAVPTERTSDGPDYAPLGWESALPAPGSDMAGPPEASLQHVPLPDAALHLPSPDLWEQFRDMNAPQDPEPPKKPVSAPPVVKPQAAPDSVVQLYPYAPDRLYDIDTSPQAATAILLPVGERLASPPLIGPKDAWTIALVQSGEGTQTQQAILIRPTEVDLHATTPLFTESGLRLFLRIKSYLNRWMVAVSWTVPPRKSDTGAAAPKTPARPTFQPPMIDRSRIHRHYTLVYDTQHRPPWVPAAVFDDGQKTVIRFAEPLTYTQAPIVAPRHADGKSGQAQTTPYTIPGRPDQGAYYVVHGLGPILDLQGADGYLVRIVRQP